jgi:hypothetical protein
LIKHKPVLYLLAPLLAAGMLLALLDVFIKIAFALHY